jgi:hypothetical protein
VDQPPTTDNSNASSRFRVAQSGALVAVFISALALGVGVYQTRLMQTQARASVWPYVTSGFRYSTYGDNRGFDLHLANNGVGPAIVRSTLVKFDGKHVKHWDEVFTTVMAAHKGESANASLSGLHGIVIPPSTNRDTDVVAIRTNDPALAEALYNARDRFAVDICYCSIYEDCWVSHWLQTEPESISVCQRTQDEFDG